MRELHLAGSYRRRVGASMRRIWENVFDWEHLPHLHEGSFRDCRLIESGAWGWQAELTLGNGDRQTIRLEADRGSARYTSTTLAGTGTGTEIRVALTPVEPHVTDVLVEFHVPEARADRIGAIGRAYVEVYARLWDEDEAMMQERERMLARRTAQDGDSVCLGREADVRTRLPLIFYVGGGSFRLLDLDGTLVAHSTVCPHWLGPLDQAQIMNGAIACPWHGYRFDLSTGQCLSQRQLKLAPAPDIRLIDGDLHAFPRNG